MQKIIVMGFVGRDPEERVTSTGKKVVSFPLGLNFKKHGEKLTVWYKVSSWNEQHSSILSYLKKGKCVIVMGDLSPPSTYQNKRGDISVDLSINADSISFGPSVKKENEKDDSIIDDKGVWC